MKKIIILIIMLFALNGCTYEYKYDFSSNEIKSTINSTFTSEEFMYNYNNQGNDPINEDSVNEVIDFIKNSTDIQAFVNDYDNSYIETKFQTGDIYDVRYEYIYNYENFKDNYVMNSCFEYFTTYEDDNSYYYNISGDYKCAYDKNIQLVVSSENKVIGSNEDIRDNNSYIWNVNAEDNDIYFSISKDISSNNKVSTFMKIMYVFVVVFIIIGVLFVAVFRKKVKM